MVVFEVFDDINEREKEGHDERSDDNADKAERLDPAEHRKEGEEKRQSGSPVYEKRTDDIVHQAYAEDAEGRQNSRFQYVSRNEKIKTDGHPDDVGADKGDERGNCSGQTPEGRRRLISVAAAERM